MDINNLMLEDRADLSFDFDRSSSEDPFSAAVRQQLVQPRLQRPKVSFETEPQELRLLQSVAADKDPQLRSQMSEALLSHSTASVFDSMVEGSSE